MTVRSRCYEDRPIDDVWEFAIYDPATDTDTLLPTADNVGTVQQALDCAGSIHLTA